jgi:hypothetical protein
MAMLVVKRVHIAPDISTRDPERAERRPICNVEERIRRIVQSRTKEEGLQIERNTNTDATDIGI